MRKSYYRVTCLYDASTEESGRLYCCCLTTTRTATAWTWTRSRACAVCMRQSLCPPSARHLALVCESGLSPSLMKKGSGAEPASQMKISWTVRIGSVGAQTGTMLACASTCPSCKICTGGALSSRQPLGTVCEDALKQGSRSCALYRDGQVMYVGNCFHVGILRRRSLGDWSSCFVLAAAR